jgi:nitrogen fixation protein NifX
MKYKVAAASSGGKVIDQHFGHASVFGIFEVDSGTGAFEFIEKREVEPLCLGFDHDDSRLEAIADLLGDCAYVLVQRIGSRPNAVLNARGVHVIEAPDLISDALVKLNRYYKIQHKNTD